MSTAAAVAEELHPKIKPNPAERARVRVSDKGDYPVKMLSIDPGRANTMPGAFTSSLFPGKRGVQGWTVKSILCVSRLRSFQVVFDRNGEEDVRMIPEHMVLNWQPEEQVS